MMGASIKRLHDTKAYLDWEITLHGWVLHTDYRIGSDLIRRYEHPQVLHMVRIQDGRKVFYKTTMLAELGIVTVMLKGSDTRVHAGSWGGSPYLPYMPPPFHAIYEIGDIVQFQNQNWRVINAWMEGQKIGIVYDLASVDPLLNDREYDVLEHLIDKPDIDFGLNAA